MEFSKKVKSFLPPSARAQYERAAAEMVSQPPRRFDDVENAERFLAEFGDDVLWCSELQKWMIWCGTHWTVDREHVVYRLAIDLVKSFYDNAVSDAEIRAARRANMRSSIESMLSLAARRKTITIDAFDANPYLLNCKNGVIDLRTGSLLPHDKSFFCSRLIEVNYTADAHSPHFERFLSDIQPDPSVRAFLQRSIGYSLLGIARERAFWILYGTGNNGKSIFINLFSKLLSGYAAGTTTATIMQTRQHSIPNDIARLKGRRFIVIPETDENEMLNASLIKALSAGDQLTARFLFGEYFDFYFSGKLWIATNHKPKILDNSKGFWDRIKVVPFTVDIPASRLIKSDDLLSRLLGEGEGVLAWAVQGVRDYFEIDGLDTPPVIQAEIERYRREQDSILQFIEECCETAADIARDNPTLYVTDDIVTANNSDLYNAYKQFCYENGEHPKSHRRFSLKLYEKGYRQARTRSGPRIWLGLRLKPN